MKLNEVLCPFYVRLIRSARTFYVKVLGILRTSVAVLLINKFLILPYDLNLHVVCLSFNVNSSILILFPYIIKKSSLDFAEQTKYLIVSQVRTAEADLESSLM